MQPGRVCARDAEELSGLMGGSGTLLPLNTSVAGKVSWTVAPTTIFQRPIKWVRWKSEKEVKVGQWFGTSTNCPVEGLVWDTSTYLRGDVHCPLRLWAAHQRLVVPMCVRVVQW